MTDRELLEDAARAAGMHANQWAEPGVMLKDKGGWVQFIGYGQCSIWNPLTDCGDALRLAVKLRLKLWHSDVAAFADHDDLPEDMSPCRESARQDRSAATRRAIVRAAAEIGRTS